ncbi:MD-2-related lipid-recognition protein-like [Lycorma delicatula]|uniref:MD-2-related lipid-recognition protein-like n=1 Tax=Lycorma delicatula TaxID=130591 RepID=UPI003F5122E9
MAYFSQYAIFGVILTIIFITIPSNSEVLPHEPCRQKDEKYTLACTVHEVRVSPCPEVSSNKPCKLTYGKNGSISFDYSADFDAEKANSRAYWDKGVIDLPFQGMNKDACQFTQCPIKAGVKSSYTYGLPITNEYPAGDYLVKWRIWNKEINKQCCFKIRIIISQ